MDPTLTITRLVLNLGPLLPPAVRLTFTSASYQMIITVQGGIANVDSLTSVASSTGTAASRGISLRSQAEAVATALNQEGARKLLYAPLASDGGAAARVRLFTPVVARVNQQLAAMPLSLPIPSGSQSLLMESRVTGAVLTLEQQAAAATEASGQALLVRLGVIQSGEPLPPLPPSPAPISAAESAARFDAAHQLAVAQQQARLAGVTAETEMAARNAAVLARARRRLAEAEAVIAANTPAVAATSAPTPGVVRAIGRAVGTGLRFLGPTAAAGTTIQGIEQVQGLANLQAEVRAIAAAPTVYEQQLGSALLQNRAARQASFFSNAVFGLTGLAQTGGGLPSLAPPPPQFQVIDVFYKPPEAAGPATAQAAPAVPPSTYALFVAGYAISVDLLTAQPSSTDPATWKRPTWGSYHTQQLVPQGLATQVDQGEWQLTWPWKLNSDQLDELWGVGLSWDGMGIVAWPISSEMGPGTLYIDVLCALVQSP